MGQECLLANSLGSHVACYIFINASDISPLLIAISPTCSKDTWKATVGSEVWASSGLPLRLPCPKDKKKKTKTKKMSLLPPAKLWPPPMNGCSLVGGHWYMLSSSRRNQQVHRKISQDGLKRPRKETWSSRMLKQRWCHGSSVKLWNCERPWQRRVRYFFFYWAWWW